MFHHRVVCCVFLLLPFTVWGHGSHGGHGKGKGHTHVSGKGGIKKSELEKDEAAINLENEEFVRNKEHILEHLKDEIDFDPETVTKEQLEFFFFNVHDDDDNDLLDGLELYLAMEHALDSHFHEIEDNEDLVEQLKTFKLQELYRQIITSVDTIINHDDKNYDGYLSYAEFAKSTRAASRLRADNIRVILPS